VRARLRRRQALGGASAFAVVTLGGALALLVLAGLVGPSTAWRPLALLALGVLAAAGTLSLWRALKTFASDDAVARFVGARVPALGGDLLSAVELERELPELEKDPVLSPVLVTALRGRVAGRLADVKPRGLVDMRALRRSSALRLGAIAVAYVLVGWLWPGALRRGWSELQSTRPDHVATSAEPIVGDLRLELRYPAYTALPPRVIPSSSGQVLALPGTEVKLSARALVPVAEAQLVVDEDGRADPDVRPVDVHAGALSSSFVVHKPGSYRFVIAGAGRRVREPDAHRIDVEPDRAPRVDLYAPSESLEVAGPRRVEIGWSVDDDYGLGEIQLVWRAGTLPEQRRTIATPQAGSRSSAGKWEWDLAELDLKPGVRVAYHLEAKDNDNVSGPNVGVSRTFYLSMFSPREKHEQAIAAQEQLLELAVRLLADRLEVKRGDDGEVADAFAAIHNRAEALLVELQRAEQAIENAGSGKSDTRNQLREIHGRLSSLTRAEEQALAELKRRKASAHTRVGTLLEGGNGKHVVELERDVILLDDLLGKQRLEELLAVGDELQQARDRLKSLLEQYKKTRSESLRKDIERELRELERRMAELEAKASKLASELPDQFLNAEAMGKNEMRADLDRIRELLEKGDVDKAMAELERMSQTLDKMVSSMEGDLRGFRRERFSAEEKAMAELEDKLTDLAHDEQQLKSETEQIQKRTRAEAQRLMRDKVDPVAKRAREKVAQLKKQVEAIEPGALPPYDIEELMRVKDQIDGLDKALAGGDVDEARSAARHAEQGLSTLDSDLHDEEARAWHGGPPGAKKAREHAEQGEQLARQIADDLNKVLPQPGEMMSAEDQKRMGELGQRQQATRKRTQELERELSRKTGADGKPIAMPPQLGDGLRQAGQHMDRAEAELNRKDARDAGGEEGQALDRLNKLQEQLQRERRPREQQAGGRLDKEPVKIPGADEYRAPKEFRQDLLEAMKRGAPGQYREQVKRYYEELVK
jgi:hypothetical protein